MPRPLSSAILLGVLLTLQAHAADPAAASASGPDALRVDLADGRVQERTISNLDGDGSDIRVDLRETRDGKELRRESTSDRQ